jgi:hypothetical protein
MTLPEALAKLWEIVRAGGLANRENIPVLFDIAKAIAIAILDFRQGPVIFKSHVSGDLPEGCRVLTESEESSIAAARNILNAMAGEEHLVYEEHAAAGKARAIAGRPGGLAATILERLLKELIASFFKNIGGWVTQ